MAATVFDVPAAELCDEDAYAARATASGMLGAALPLILAEIAKLRAIARDTMQEAREADDVDVLYWKGRMDALQRAASEVRSWGDGS